MLCRANICAVGRALYGPSWQRPLAEALGVADRTVRRWAAGDAVPSPGVWADLRTLVGARIAEINDVINKINELE